MRSKLLKDTLLLVGDADSDRATLRGIFKTTYNLLEAENIEQAQLLLEQNRACIAAVVADVPLTPKEPIRAMVKTCRSKNGAEIPLLLTVLPGRSGAQEELAFVLGATDVVLKPYTQTTVRRRLQVLVDLYLHQQNLEDMVAEQSETIRHTNQVMIDALSAIIEHRSTESGNHVLRIRRFTKILLGQVAKSCPEYALTDEAIDIIASASALHDIGKISIPDAILNKPDRLTGEEFAVMMTHTTVGGELIKNLADMGDVEFLRYAYNIALYHHERWDGNGYPCGLVGEDIPICAQVVGIADAYDALTTTRVYKPAVKCGQAVNMILNGECGVFSPKLLECFKRVRIAFAELARQYADGYSPKSDQITMPLPGPVWQPQQIDFQQLMQMKYQTLLHYSNDTVMELDLDHKVFHMVYNPSPEFDHIAPDSSYDEVIRRIAGLNVHPEDRAQVETMEAFCREEFFLLKQRRKTQRLRIYSAAYSRYLPYELSFLRIDTDDPNRRMALLIWHRLEDWLPAPAEAAGEQLFTAPALYGLTGSVLRCESDERISIRARSDLSALVGYTDSEITEHFSDSLMELIVPADRSSVAAALRELPTHGGQVEIEYRLFCKDADPVWVLDRCRLHTEPGGAEYCYHALSDHTGVVNSRRKLEAAVERNRIIIEQSEGISFEWDIASDTVSYSGKWARRFGYEPISKNFSEQIQRASHFHPDDLPIIRAKIEALRLSAPASSIDARIANSSGVYLWNKIWASMQYDAAGKPVRLLGLITDIDDLKRAALSLKEQAERDALTKLLNKSSTQLLIAEHMTDREPNTLSAMMILDLDNFKAVNDGYGHLYGDTVLAEIGGSLRKLFRAHDIVGRIGGDEFLIFLKDIPNEQMLRERCSLLLLTFRELFERFVPDLEVSCSIGVSLAPQHGTTYNELFRHADAVLYQIKKNGKNDFGFYDPVRTNASTGGVSTISRIDSDEQPGMADNSFVYYVFRSLYDSSDVEKTVDELLEYIGQELNVSRTYIFENSEDNLSCSNTFEWCNEGITPEKEFLQNVSYVTDIPGWPEVYDESGLLYCTDISTLAEPFRKILEPQNIKSMLQCAIMDGGVFRGYVGFDECKNNRPWTQDQIRLLRFLAEMLALFLLKKRSQDKVADQAENLRRVLDHQDAWIYVVDAETHSLCFANEKARRQTPEAQPGMQCFAALMQRPCSCEGCPIGAYQDGRSEKSVVRNERRGVDITASAAPLSWDGKAAWLVTCWDEKHVETERE